MVWLLLCGEGGVDDVGEPPFEDPECFQAAVSAGFAPGHQVFRGGMSVRLCHRDAVQGGVELPVPGPAEAVVGFIR